MGKTLQAVREEVLRRLGDSTSVIWLGSEIDRYLNEGYERIAIKTGLLWDMTYLEDQSYAGTHTADWETNYFESGFLTLNQFHYTADWELDYAFGDQLSFGPANHTTTWEYDNDYHVKSHFVAVHRLPSELVEIERAVWNKRRIEPLYSSELESSDSQYQTQQGEVLGYVRDKDGPRSFRKWRIPSSAADEYTITGYGYTANYTASWEVDEAPATFTLYEQFTYNYPWEKEYVTASLQSIPPSTHTSQWEFVNTTNFGILRDPSDISGELVLGTWGIPRRIPGGHPCAGDGLRGTARRFYKAAKNTKIEYTKKGEKLVEDADEFELPNIYVKDVRHFALYRALERDGNGQDLEFAAFWKGLWEAGIQRAVRRKQSLMKTRKHILGGGIVESRRPPLARLPWQYPRTYR